MVGVHRQLNASRSSQSGVVSVTYGEACFTLDTKGVSVNESISLDLSPSELSFALSRRYRTKASKRQRLWWRCDAANRPPTRAPAGREPTDASGCRIQNAAGGACLDILHVFYTYPKRVQDTFGIHIRYITIHVGGATRWWWGEILKKRVQPTNTSSMSGGSTTSLFY